MHLLLYNIKIIPFFASSKTVPTYQWCTCCMLRTLKTKLGLLGYLLFVDYANYYSNIAYGI